MLPEYFALIGAVIASLGELKYLYDTVRGTIQPNRVTWFLWAVFPLITYAAQRAQGVDALAWTSLAAGTFSVMIFVATFINKKAYWKTEPLDYVCMALAFLGIALWAVTKTPNVAIVFSIAADLAAGLPTAIKAYKVPRSESWRSFALCTVGYGVSLLAVHHWAVADYGFVLYLTVNNAIIALLAARRPRAPAVPEQ